MGRRVCEASPLSLRIRATTCLLAAASLLFSVALSSSAPHAPAPVVQSPAAGEMSTVERVGAAATAVVIPRAANGPRAEHLDVIKIVADGSGAREKLVAPRVAGWLVATIGSGLSEGPADAHAARAPPVAIA